MSTEKKEINVVAAVIHDGGNILCARKGTAKYSYISGTWEFPGGKIEPGETMAKALRREIREELAMGIEVGDLIMSLRHEYPDFTINLHAFRCSPLPGESPTCLEHAELRWLPPQKLPTLNWAPADADLIAHLSQKE